MADQERDIHIPFNSGFDDFTDDRWKPDGRISTITNAEWNQEGRLEKRRGFEAFTESGVRVGSLASFGSTYISIAPEHLSIYNPNQDSLTPTRVGTFLDVQTYQAGSFQDVGEPQISIAYSSNLYMVAWSSFTDGDVYACFYDRDSKRPLTEIYQVASGTFTNVTAHAYNGFFAIVASNADDGGQYVWRNPTVLPVHDNWTQESLGGLFEHAYDIDSYADDDTIYIVGHTVGSTATMRVVTTSVMSSGVLATTDLIWSLGQTEQWCINKTDTNLFAIVGVCVTLGRQVGFCVIDNTFGYVRPDVSLGFGIAENPTVGPSPDPTYTHCISFYQNSGVSLYNDLVVVFRDPVGGVSRVKRSGTTHARSAPWVDPVTGDQCLVARRLEGFGEQFTSSAVVFVSNDEVLNYNILDAYKIGIKCRYADLGFQAENYTDDRPLKSVEVSSTMRAWAEVSKVQTMPPSFVVRIVECEAKPQMLARGFELAGGMYTSRGPSIFDGIQLTELGFWGSPRVVDTVKGTGGFLTNGATYLYGTEWEVQNALGDTKRSMPTSISVALSAPGEDDVTNTYDAISPTNWGIRNDRGTDPYIVQYRTAANLETLRRVLTQTDVDQGAYNLAPILDTAADTDIADHPIIYTDGAQLPPLEDTLPPCFGDICVYKNRVIGVADDGITLWVSTDKRPSEQLRFNEVLNIQIADGGRIYAIAAEQDRFLVFKQNDIFAVYGEGADERGVGASFNLPIPIAQNIGCTRPGSVIATPVGVFFQGGPGIMRITGSQVDFIGNAVRDTFPGVVSACAHSAEQQKVFFACHNEDLDDDQFMILVYDYRFNRWTKWTYTHPTGLTGENLRILGMVVYDERLHCALGDRTYIIRQKTESSSSSHLDYTDTWVTMSVEFAPIKTSGPQGFQHVKKVMVIGERGSRHNLTVSFANNYSSSYYQTVSWTANVIDTWTTLPLEQFSSKPSQPRCEAIKVKIEDAEPSQGASGTGQGLKLVGLSLTVANKNRLMRLGSPYKR